MVTSQRVIQIISAEGWVAVYECGSADVQDLRTVGLACWALVEEGGATRVIGMDAGLVAGQPPRGTFLGYARVSEGLARFKRQP